MNKISLWLRASRTRIIGLILLVLFSIAYVLPTFHILPEPLAQKWPFKSVVNLGLDLQGGSYLVFYVDVNKALHQSLQSQLENIRKTLKEKGSQVDFDFHFESESPPTAVILGSSEVLTQVETSLKENSTRYHIYFDSDRKLLAEKLFSQNHAMTHIKPPLKDVVHDRHSQRIYFILHDVVGQLSVGDWSREQEEQYCRPNLFPHT